MNNKIGKFILFVLILLFGISAGMQAQQTYEKRAQTGLQFLSVVSDARAAAMASAMTSSDLNSAALFFNPAGMATMSSTIDASFSLNQWIADITHQTFSIAIRPGNGQYGVLGFSLQNIDYGEILHTVVANNEQGFLDVDYPDPTASAFGVGYAKQLNDRFSVGGQLKFVKQDLGQASTYIDTTTTKLENADVSPLAFDFGTLYQTGYKSLAFGMSVRNFSQEIKYAEENFQLPLVFTLGISMNVLDFYEMGSDQALYVALDASHYRSRPEEMKIGVEYLLKNMLSLRGGYSNGDDMGISYGLGVKFMGGSIDYAYSPFDNQAFEDIQRFTVRFGF